MLFLGIDIGTQGVRGLVSDHNGDVLAGYSENFSILNCSSVDGWYEQNPGMWWEIVKMVIAGCIRQLELAGHHAGEIRAVSVDGTSGTILPIDENGHPLIQALMYNDMRSVSQAEKVHQKGLKLEQRMGLKFNASFALPKILWIKENLPDVYRKAKMFIHQADYITGNLTGMYSVTDHSNALKTGYDLQNDNWPSLISELGLDLGKFPLVKAPGHEIAPLTKQVVKEFGFSDEAVVTAGATDGYASALASGAVRVGDWASIIGTTLVLKGVTRELLADPSGSSYSHKLPSGAWMLGGASNMGGRCLNDFFDKTEFEGLNKTVMQVIPTGVISYPLHGTGERFPFLDPRAKAFVLGDISDPRVHYAALMEGVAYAERFAFERMIEYGAEVGDVIYTTGGACKSDEWMKIRASVLGRQLKVPKVADAAMGCVLLAASTTYYSSLEEASAKMISIRKTVNPIPELVYQYEELYQQTCREYTERFQLTRFPVRRAK